MWFKVTFLIAFWSSVKFQNFSWEVSRFLERLHDLVIVWLTVILVVVLVVARNVVLGLKGIRRLDSETLEKTWTVLPIIILVSIAYPSIHLLCLQDSGNQSPNSTLKIWRNQWNWQREVRETVDHLRDSESLDVLTSLEAPVLLQMGRMVRVILVSSDVIHSLGMPRLRMKLDSIPGRIRGTVLECFRPGVFIGSCYELCGSGHRAIPISLLVVYRE